MACLPQALSFMTTFFTLFWDTSIKKCGNVSFTRHMGKGTNTLLSLFSYEDFREHLLSNLFSLQIFTWHCLGFEDTVKSLSSWSLQSFMKRRLYTTLWSYLKSPHFILVGFNMLKRKRICSLICQIGNEELVKQEEEILKEWTRTVPLIFFCVYESHEDLVKLQILNQ